MLETCLNYYGLYNELNYSLSLHKLEQLAYEQHPTGYKQETSPKFSLSYFEIKTLLTIYQESDYDYMIQDIFRYAAYFGIIQDVIISPFHIEWSYNSFHQRDLFFTSLRLEIRELHRTSSMID